MSPRVLLLPLLLAAVLSWARDRQATWVEVRSQHFSVVCNGNPRQAQRIADQFERMRLVIHNPALPHMPIDPGAPIVVIAVKDAKTFRALEPKAYLAKGQLELAGVFLPAADKNYVLLRMDAGGEHPYAAVYHEYTHLLLSKAEWIPLWLNEGLAEFYENTDIRQKGTVLGQPSADNILFLRQNQLLPLPILFTVDRNSPYYHEEEKGSIFYAESWALTRYLEMQDLKNHTEKLRDYIQLVSGQVDSVSAAIRAFGDLKELQATLQHYIEQPTSTVEQLASALPPRDATFTTQPLAPPQAEAVLADFLAYNRREQDSRALLEQVLREDPNNTLAHETMGYLEFRAGQLEQAERWYDEAVKLDSQSYLANYYFAAIALNHGQAGVEVDARIESSLQKAIKLNPSFAPSYDRLAVFYGLRRRNLDQAHMLTLQAVQLDPGNIGFRINAASILLIMGRYDDAVSVSRAALKLAKTPGEVMAAQNGLRAAQQAQSAQERGLQPDFRLGQPRAAWPQPSVKPAAAQIPSGPHRTVTGTVRHVRCSAPAILDFDLEAGGKTIALHAGNYFKIGFSALNYAPRGGLHPCSDLEGRHATVEYVVSAAPETNAPVTIELY